MQGTNPNRKEDRVRMRLQARQICSASIRVMLLSFVVLSGSAQEARRLVIQGPPAYPAAAKTMRLIGTVKVQVIIAKDGQIKDTKVLGGHPVLVDATLDALKKWKYAPAPSESTALLEFNFHP